MPSRLRKAGRLMEGIRGRSDHDLDQDGGASAARSRRTCTGGVSLPRIPPRALLREALPTLADLMAKVVSQARPHEHATNPPRRPSGSASNIWLYSAAPNSMEHSRYLMLGSLAELE